MGRVKKRKVKIPAGKNFTSRSREMLQDKTTKILYKLARERHPDIGHYHAGTTTCLRPVHDRDNHTVYMIAFRECVLPKPRTPRRRIGESAYDASLRRKPIAAQFLVVQEYLEPQPLIYMEWIVYENSMFGSKTDAQKIFGAFEFMPLKAIEFYARECKRCYGGLYPRKYEPPPLSKEIEPKLRRFDIA